MPPVVYCTIMIAVPQRSIITFGCSYSRTSGMIGQRLLPSNFGSSELGGCNALCMVNLLAHSLNSPIVQGALFHGQTIILFP